ncbi:SDR family NAD(P)-dependent oxidoreductase [Methanoplanus limicola]|uniref:Short-chain dehydrogenase/reductase SDR n=1 Tax=Methanoplanus limicola DSM 2279 TaxID=937775 RepID=H1YXB0_9EURY|nr:SDR family oxidoreductase [Methanoplanus limicola]EHQ36847.1 short-chain dehydrogenase/reductase SDR [Methanoplanus limicola DSM 2279]
MSNLIGKIALVSGSSKGIGKAIAKKLLEEGAIVYITGRNGKDLNDTFLEFQSISSERINQFCGDLTDIDNIKKLMQVIIKKNGRLDILVANIGSGRFSSGWDISDEEWEKCMELNLFSSIKITREAIKIMEKNGSGNIIIMSSIAGCESISAPITYSTAKAGLLAYMKSTSHTIGSSGIRINAISPGNIYFKGGTWYNKMQEDEEKTIQYISDNVPLHKFGIPEDIAEVVCFLVSEKSQFITGANFVIDGGQTRCL